MSTTASADRLLADVTALLAARPGRVLVGIAGPPGAGKSTLAQRITDAVHGPGGVVAGYVPMDGFHLSNAQLARLGRAGRKGAPDTFDVAGYVAVLQRIRAEAGRADVYVPDFDRALDEPVAAGRVVPAEARLVVTEGNYLAVDHGGWQAVRPLLDRLYYLDCDAALRRRRLVRRHRAGGRSAAEAHRWVDDVDEPNARIVAATRARCDLLVPG